MVVPLSALFLPALFMQARIKATGTMAVSGGMNRCFLDSS